MTATIANIFNQRILGMRKLLFTLLIILMCFSSFKSDSTYILVNPTPHLIQHFSYKNTFNINMCLWEKLTPPDNSSFTFRYHTFEKSIYDREVTESNSTTTGLDSDLNIYGECGPDRECSFLNYLNGTMYFTPLVTNLNVVSDDKPQIVPYQNQNYNFWTYSCLSYIFNSPSSVVVSNDSSNTYTPFILITRSFTHFFDWQTYSLKYYFNFDTIRYQMTRLALYINVNPDILTPFLLSSQFKDRNLVNFPNYLGLKFLDKVQAYTTILKNVNNTQETLASTIWETLPLKYLPTEAVTNNTQNIGDLLSYASMEESPSSFLFDMLNKLKDVIKGLKTSYKLMSVDDSQYKLKICCFNIWDLTSMTSSPFLCGNSPNYFITSTDDVKHLDINTIQNYKYILVQIYARVPVNPNNLEDGYNYTTLYTNILRNFYSEFTPHRLLSSKNQSSPITISLNPNEGTINCFWYNLNYIFITESDLPAIQFTYNYVSSTSETLHSTELSIFSNAAIKLEGKTAGYNTTPLSLSVKDSLSEWQFMCISHLNASTGLKRQITNEMYTETLAKNNILISFSSTDNYHTYENSKSEVNTNDKTVNKLNLSLSTLETNVRLASFVMFSYDSRNTTYTFLDLVPHFRYSSFSGTNSNNKILFDNFADLTQQAVQSLGLICSNDDKAVIFPSFRKDNVLISVFYVGFPHFYIPVGTQKTYYYARIRLDGELLARSTITPQLTFTCEFVQYTQGYNTELSISIPTICQCFTIRVVTKISNNNYTFSFKYDLTLLTRFRLNLQLQNVNYMRTFNTIYDMNLTKDFDSTPGLTNMMIVKKYFYSYLLKLSTSSFTVKLDYPTVSEISTSNANLTSDKFCTQCKLTNSTGGTNFTMPFQYQPNPSFMYAISQFTNNENYSYSSENVYHGIVTLVTSETTTSDKSPTTTKYHDKKYYSPIEIFLSVNLLNFDTKNYEIDSLTNSVVSNNSVFFLYIKNNEPTSNSAILYNFIFFDRTNNGQTNPNVNFSVSFVIEYMNMSLYKIIMKRVATNSNNYLIDSYLPPIITFYRQNLFDVYVIYESLDIVYYTYQLTEANKVSYYQNLYLSCILFPITFSQNANYEKVTFPQHGGFPPVNKTVLVERENQIRIELTQDLISQESSINLQSMTISATYGQALVLPYLNFTVPDVSSCILQPLAYIKSNLYFYDALDANFVTNFDLIKFSVFENMFEIHFNPACQCKKYEVKAGDNIFYLSAPGTKFLKRTFKNSAKNITFQYCNEPNNTIIKTIPYENVRFSSYNGTYNNTSNSDQYIFVPAGSSMIKVDMLYDSYFTSEALIGNIIDIKRSCYYTITDLTTKDLSDYLRYSDCFHLVLDSTIPGNALIITYTNLQTNYSVKQTINLNRSIKPAFHMNTNLTAGSLSLVLFIDHLSSSYADVQCRIRVCLNSEGDLCNSWTTPKSLVHNETISLQSIEQGHPSLTHLRNITNDFKNLLENNYNKKLKAEIMCIVCEETGICEEKTDTSPPNPRPSPPNPSPSPNNTYINNKDQLKIINNPTNNNTLVLNEYNNSNFTIRQIIILNVTQAFNISTNSEDTFQTSILLNKIISQTNCTASDCKSSSQIIQTTIVDKLSQILNCTSMFNTIFGASSPKSQLILSALSLYHATSNYESFTNSSMYKVTDITSCLVEQGPNMLNMLESSNATNATVIQSTTQDFINTISSISSNMINLAKTNNENTNNTSTLGNITLNSNMSLVISESNLKVKDMIERNSILFFNYTNRINKLSQRQNTTSLMATSNLVFVGGSLNGISDSNSRSGRILISSIRHLQNITLDQHILDIESTNSSMKIFLPVNGLHNYSRNISNFGAIFYNSYPLLASNNGNVSENVISLKMYDDSFNGVEVKNLSEPIQLLIKKPEKSYKNCVFYSPENLRWANDQCVSIDLNDYMLCICNHLTDFTLAKYNPIEIIEGTIRLFIDARIMDSFELFKNLTWDNAFIVYLYGGIFISYLLALIYTLWFDLTSEEDSFITDTQVEETSCFDCQTDRTVNNIIEIKEITDHAVENRRKKLIKKFFTQFSQNPAEKKKLFELLKIHVDLNDEPKAESLSEVKKEIEQQKTNPNAVESNSSTKVKPHKKTILEKYINKKRETKISKNQNEKKDINSHVAIEMEDKNSKKGLTSNEHIKDSENSTNSNSHHKSKDKISVQIESESKVLDLEIVDDIIKINNKHEVSYYTFLKNILDVNRNNFKINILKAFKWQPLMDLHSDGKARLNTSQSESTSGGNRSNSDLGLIDDKREDGKIKEKMKEELVIKREWMVRAKSVLTHFFVMEYTPLVLILPKNNEMPKTNRLSLVVFRLFTALSLCALFSDTNSKSGCGDDCYANKNLSVSVGVILVIDIPFTLFETILAKKKVYVAWTKNKKLIVKISAIVQHIFVYLIFVALMVLGSLNTIWVSLYAEDKNQKTAFVSDFVNSVIFDYFVYEVIVIVTKSTIFFTIVKSEEIAWWKRCLVYFVATLPWVILNFILDFCVELTHAERGKLIFRY